MASPRCLHSNPSLTFSILPKADYDKIGMEEENLFPRYETNEI